MIIHSIRLGHACNSSSTHSLIMLPSLTGRKGKKATDDYTPFEFGWEYFTLASKEAKTEYLATMLFNNLSGIVDVAIAHAVVKEWTGVELPGDPTSRWGINAYVDHQSIYEFPQSRNSETPGLDYQFFKEFSDYICQDGLVILGGNDNREPGEKGHPLAGCGHRADLPMVQDSGDRFVARKDVIYDYWTMFNMKTGAKIRFSFDDTSRPPVKAYAPELVDLKITSKCPFECEFCYQDSKPEGVHADTDYINTVLQHLGKMGVFEVAIGGGEPTIHPNFLSVLSQCQINGMNANFTTKNLAWLKDPKKAEAILKASRCFAYSVENAEQITEFLALCKEREVDPDQRTVQVVMGTVDPAEFRKILDAVKGEPIRLMLLGYKKVGRGPMFTPWQYNTDLFTEVLAQRMKEYSVDVAIDTQLAIDWKDWLEKYEVPKHLYHTKEGAFSCYIDAVEKRIGPSSYCDDSAFVGLKNPSENDILTAFGAF